MAIQHSNISDADRHEAKGASTATVGQVLQADGDGTTSFVSPSTLRNISIQSTLENSSLTTQGPSAADTPYQVTWGAGSANTDANVASNGIITILTTGLYLVTFNLNFGRAGNTASAIMFARLLLNDTPTGIVQGVRIDASTDITPAQFQIFRTFAANDTLKVQMIRDSAGNNDGSLLTLDPTLAGWANSPSALVRIQKVLGGY